MKSTPAGARVLVDGVDRGATPLALKVAPGRYHLELRLSGYLPQKAEATVGFADDAKVEVALVASH